MHLGLALFKGVQRSERIILGTVKGALQTNTAIKSSDEVSVFDKNMHRLNGHPAELEQIFYFSDRGQVRCSRVVLHRFLLFYATRGQTDAVPLYLQWSINSKLKWRGRP